MNTLDQIQMGLKIDSTKVSSLATSASDKAIGSRVRHHLSLCEFELPNPADRRSVQINFLKAAGFKNAKESYNKARHVYIVKKDGILTITPTINRASMKADW